MISPLTRRVLTVNVLAVAVLGAGLLYLGQYERGLIEAEIESLTTQAEIFAGALGQGAVGVGADGRPGLRPTVAGPMLRRLTEPTPARALLFDMDERVVADSRTLAGPGAAVQEEALPPPEADGVLAGLLFEAYALVLRLLPDDERVRAGLYRENESGRAGRYAEVAAALNGETRASIRYDEDGRMVLVAALPVQRFKAVLGALMLAARGDEIEATVRDVRLDIFKAFGLALCVTVVLSLYLAGTITRPVRRLAAAARRVRGGQSELPQIPDFTRRGDEIGDLSAALRGMTAEIWSRMEAVERFAADVAHEIKNPLTSLRSAVETASRIEDPDQQRRLMDIVQQDVTRLDRLISDISSASRLDAELARTAMRRVDLGRLLDALVAMHRSDEGETGTALTLDLAVDRGGIDGIETRLVQVFGNLLSNAFSFSPAGAAVRIALVREDGFFRVTVDDDGPGIPEESLESVFQRFYTERPPTEDFGTHSGLGLSISRQIVEAHGGSITAANRYRGDGGIAGARLTVRLPAADP